MSMDLYLRFAAALVFVVALIAFIGWVARRAGLGTRLPRAGGKQRRVGIVEVVPLDAKRRLVLVRRDQVEHLLLVGPGSDIVVEQNIATAGGSAGSPAFETMLKSDAEPEAAA
jgi:flagellar protein FliO/FliZ